jgi:hypothetical protein
MKKVLLLFASLISLILSVQCAFAYESVIVDFPDYQGWHEVYYDVQGDEAILQYVPAGQTYQSWTKTVVFHSYKGANMDSASSSFLDTMTAQMERQNPTSGYTYNKYTEADSIATRCTQKTNYAQAQCEIFRVSNSYEALISMHYINKNTQDFKSTYDYWYKIIQGIRIYYSYYRTDRVLDKATIFEL